MMEYNYIPSKNTEKTHKNAINNKIYQHDQLRIPDTFMGKH